MSGDHLGRHLTNAPRLVGRRGDDRVGGDVVPHVQEAPRRPHAWPVTVGTAVSPFEYVLSARSANHAQKVIIHVPSADDRHTVLDDDVAATSIAFELDRLLGRHSPDARCQVTLFSPRNSWLRARRRVWKPGTAARLRVLDGSVSPPRRSSPR